MRFINVLLTYLLTAWWEYLKADERNRLQAVIKKAIRCGYLPRSFSTLDELSEDSDDKLFSYLQPQPCPALPSPPT